MAGIVQDTISEFYDNGSIYLPVWNLHKEELLDKVGSRTIKDSNLKEYSFIPKEALYLVRWDEFSNYAADFITQRNDPFIAGRLAEGEDDSVSAILQDMTINDTSNLLVNGRIKFDHPGIDVAWPGIIIIGLDDNEGGLAKYASLFPIYEQMNPEITKRISRYFKRQINEIAEATIENDGFSIAEEGLSQWPQYQTPDEKAARKLDAGVGFDPRGLEDMISSAVTNGLNGLNGKLNSVHNIVSDSREMDLEEALQKSIMLDLDKGEIINEKKGLFKKDETKNVYVVDIKKGYEGTLCIRPQGSIPVTEFYLESIETNNTLRKASINPFGAKELEYKRTDKNNWTKLDLKDLNDPQDTIIPLNKNSEIAFLGMRSPPEGLPETITIELNGYVNNRRSEEIPLKVRFVTPEIKSGNVRKEQIMKLIGAVSNTALAAGIKAGSGYLGKVI